MRLFIAVNFDEDTRRTLLQIQNRLRRLSAGTFSRPENLHLTLAFLGEVERARLPDVKAAMEKTPMPSLTLRFTRMGAFRRGEEALCWVGLAEDPALRELQRGLSLRLQAAGFPLEERPFTPHITLARRLRLPPDADLASLLSAPFETRIEHMSLMLSQRIQGQLRYSELCRR